MNGEGVTFTGWLRGGFVPPAGKLIELQFFDRGGRVTIGIDGSRVLVRTFAAAGTVQDLPFSVIVAC